LPFHDRETTPVPQPTKNAAKKRPIPTRRSPVLKGGKAHPAPHTGAEDDVKITALKLPPGKLSPEMDAYFKKCDEKLGFVPNVLKAFAFDDAKLQAFVEYRQQLVQNAASLSKLEIEMIATAVSSQNRCFYCITAHGNAVRQLGGPVLGEMMVMNYRAARLDKRQRAMLDFAVKLTTQPWEVEEDDRGSGVIAESLLLLPDRTRCRGAAIFRQPAARRTDRDELPRRAPVQAPARHARLCRQAHRRALARRRG